MIGSRGIFHVSETIADGKAIDYPTVWLTSRTLRGDLQSAALVARRRRANATRRSNAPDHYQPARQQSTIQAVLTSLAGSLGALKATAEQWTDADRLRAILARAFTKFMRTTAGPPALPTSEPTAT